MPKHPKPQIKQALKQTRRPRIPSISNNVKQQHGSVWLEALAAVEAGL